MKEPSQLSYAKHEGLARDITTIMDMVGVVSTAQTKAALLKLREKIRDIRAVSSRLVPD